MPLGEAIGEAVGLPPIQALAELGDLPRRALKRDREPAGRLVLPDGVGPMIPIHRRYLERRGFDPDKLASVWGVCGIAWHPRLAWRVFVPIRQGGDVVSWTTRAVSDANPQRYITARRDESVMPRREILFGVDHCRHAVVVVEGPFDAMRIGPGAAATLGLKWSREQVARLAAFPVRAVCLDAEPEARARASRLADELAAFPGSTSVVELETGKDPAEASDREIREIRRRFLE